MTSNQTPKYSIGQEVIVHRSVEEYLGGGWFVWGPIERIEMTTIYIILFTGLVLSCLIILAIGKNRMKEHDIKIDRIMQNYNNSISQAYYKATGEFLLPKVERGQH